MVRKGEYWITKSKHLVYITKGETKRNLPIGKIVTVKGDGSGKCLYGDEEAFEIGDELIKRLTRKEVHEWLEVEMRESEAIADAKK